MNEENAPAGKPLNSYEIVYDQAAIDAYLARGGESAALYTHDGTLTVPPGMFLGAYGRLIHETFHYEAGVHTASQLTVHRCPPVGTKATVSGEIIRTFERNGDKYVTFSVRVADAEGPCAEVEHTSIYGLRSRA
jgi:hypothetical protein